MFVNTSHVLTHLVHEKLTYREGNWTCTPLARVKMLSFNIYLAENLHKQGTVLVSHVITRHLGLLPRNKDLY